MKATPKYKDCEFARNNWCELYDIALPMYGECYNWYWYDEEN